MLGRPTEALRVFNDMEALGGGLDFPMLANKAYALLCLAELEDAANILVNAEPAISTAEEKAVFVANAALHAILSGESSLGLDLYDRAERLGLDVSEEFRTKVFINRMLAKTWMGISLIRTSIRKHSIKRPPSNASTTSLKKKSPILRKPLCQHT